MDPGQSSPPTVASLTAFLTNALLRTVVTDLAIEEHRKECRRRAEGWGLDSVELKGMLAPLRASTPGTSTSPAKKDKDDALYECLNCQRSIGSARYASHLSGCLGLSGNGGTRRRAAAAAAAASNGAAKNGLPRLGASSSYVSEDEALSGTEKKTNVVKLGLNSNNKRSASQPPSNSNVKPKKARPIPAPIASHPLAKTLSAPQSPIKPLGLPTPPPSQSPAPTPVALAARPIPIAAAVPGSSPHKQMDDDRPDSDSSDDDSDAGKKRGPVPLSRNGVGVKVPKMPLKRPPHPLARGVLSDSDASDGSGSDSD
ncbi:Sgf11, transcriptional regulation [Pseudohyphozyma bogoriensis]|nr:Sgf11, transcriptional regulation [Pseudohyphozyma bogoriensis]